MTEAKELYSLQSQFNMGYKLGFGAGVFAAYAIYRSKFNPLPYFKSKGSPSNIFGLLIACSGLGWLIFDRNRKAGKTPIGDFYSTNLLMENKTALTSKHEVFNRKFTEDEVEQMLFNGKLKVYGRKKYIYNPNVHGDNEEVFKDKHERFNSGKLHLTSKLKNEIISQNTEKIENGEHLLFKPFRADHNISMKSLRSTNFSNELSLSRFVA